MMSRSAVDGFLFDPHIHTDEVSPCGKLPAGEVARLYTEAGYDGIVITDHFRSRTPQDLGCEGWPACVNAYLDGYRIAEEEGRKVGLTVLWGLEYTPDNGPAGDFLVYGADEKFLLDNPDITSLDLSGLRNRVEGEDILIYQAHPFRGTHVLAPVELLDGIEVVNANPRHAHDHERAFREAALHGLAGIAGSDTHQLEDIGRAGLIFPEKPESMREFVAMLKSGDAEIARFDQEPA